MEGSHTHQEQHATPIWKRALENYREELAAEDDFRDILETRSLEQVMNDSKISQPFGPKGRNALDSMNRLKPTFQLINDFSAVLVACFGAEATLTALIWGSIRMILRESGLVLNCLLYTNACYSLHRQPGTPLLRSLICSMN